MIDKLNSIRDRIMQQKDLQGLSYQDLADATGMSKSTIQRYVTGSIGNLGLDKVETLARALNCSPGYLMGWETDPGNAAIFRYDNISKIDKKEIPLMLTPVHCGEPTYADDHVATYYPIGDDLNVDFCLTCAGDSMIEAGIEDGDIVLVRRQPDVENGEIAVVSLGDEATLKRVYKHQSKNIVELRPANSAYDSIILFPNDMENVRILGKVIVVMKYV